MSESSPTAEDVLKKFSVNSQKAVSRILNIEYEYQDLRNISAAGQTEKEIAKRIRKVIDEELET